MAKCSAVITANACSVTNSAHHYL